MSEGKQELTSTLIVACLIACIFFGLSLIEEAVYEEEKISAECKQILEEYYDGKS